MLARPCGTMLAGTTTCDCYYRAKMYRVGRYTADEECFDPKKALIAVLSVRWAVAGKRDQLFFLP